MPPPRGIRLQDAKANEPTPDDVMDAMRAYAEAHQVQEMLHIMLTRLMEAQPLDPFELLIKVVREDAEMDTLELNARINRLDLRREKVKKQLVVGFYKRLLALQRTQHKDPAVAHGPELATTFLLSQLRLDETRAYLRTQFPKHYRSLIDHLLDQAKEFKSAVNVESFTRSCLGVLALAGGS
ncbi:hypothetical protein Poli38472_006772 [Pythium oligandrum]|uniref:Uncharacterized protein n=1 Tax=Pythium oligandrum TaxID=41045 RepID=A0A8K1FEL2_PYTOL|nr:hypothetical protein Poli38472_006772 [Pythium oligandrum]|eukprot:TMW56762.1 hypothetical protein Poli38472_006772 [Pythium oligandrum]